MSLRLFSWSKAIVSHRDLGLHEVTLSLGKLEDEGTLVIIPQGCEFSHHPEAIGRKPAYGIYTSGTLECGEWRCPLGGFVSPTTYQELGQLLETPSLKEPVDFSGGYMSLRFHWYSDDYVQLSGVHPACEFSEDEPKLQLSMRCFISKASARRGAAEIADVLSFVEELERSEWT